MSMTELEAARFVRAALDLIVAEIGDSAPAITLDLLALRNGSHSVDVERIERDAPPWEPEPEPAANRPWANVMPGDSVQAPNGEWYEVDSTSRIGHRVVALLKVGSGTVRTERLAAERVPSRRGPEGRAVDVFAAGGLTLERIGR